MQFSVCQKSHIGARKVNQDRMGYGYTRDRSHIESLIARALVAPAARACHPDRNK